MTFTKIERHPLQNSYVLYIIGTNLPPFIGSLKECKEAQKIAEKKANKEFNKMTKKEKINFLEFRKKYYNF